VSWRLAITDDYRERAKRFLQRHPADLVARYFRTIEVLDADPHHPSLRLHALPGKLAGLHSVSINLSYCITIEMEIHAHEIVPVNVGTHEEVYR
jgi:mRNA-degrading endonuclease YafQ of YafQ-DinJ toxin-antitoxin module